MPKFDFPVWLIGTPEEQEAERNRQALLAASFTRAKKTDAERMVGQGALIAQTARQNLEQSFGVEGKEEEMRLAESQLAEGLAMQGKFAEAAEVHPSAERREEFKEIIEAIEMPDEEKCDCSDTVAEIYQDEKGKKAREAKDAKDKKHDGQILVATPRFERQKVFSAVHGQEVSLVECSKCGHVNARPLTGRLLKHQSALSQSEAVKHPVLTDAQVLNDSAK